MFSFGEPALRQPRVCCTIESPMKKSTARRMTIPEAFAGVRYVVDANGEKKEAIIPLAAWKMLLAMWKKSVELLEDQEDYAILKNWLSRRESGKLDMISLEDLEQELKADGLI